jgi:hypothetical protein
VYANLSVEKVGTETPWTKLSLTTTERSHSHHLDYCDQTYSHSHPTMDHCKNLRTSRWLGYFASGCDVGPICSLADMTSGNNEEHALRLSSKPCCNKTKKDQRFFPSTSLCPISGKVILFVLHLLRPPPSEFMG